MNMSLGPTWQSLDDLVAEFGLDADPQDVNAVRDELRRELARNHPDREGGAFSSSAAEARFRRLAAAVEFCDRAQTTAVVRVAELPHIAKVLREIGELSPQQRRTELRRSAREESRHRVLLPRLGSGAAAGICAALIAFSGQLKEDPVFGPLFESKSSRSILLFVFFVAALMFLRTWWVEQRLARRVEWLTTDDGRRYIFARVFEEKAEQGETASITFSLSDIKRAILRRHGSPEARVFSGFLGGDPAPATAEEIARTHVQELEASGVISRSSHKSFEPMYEIDREIAQQARQWY